MNFRSIDLNLITVFDAIFAERNLTRAARKIGMSQPAMSNALARLRIALDDPLFIRTSHGVMPTPRSRALATPIHQAIDLLQAGLGKADAFDFASSNRAFILAMEDYGEVVIVPRFVDWLSQVAPDIRVRIRPEKDVDLKKALTQGQIDFAVDYFPIQDEDVEVQQLTEEVLVSMVRSGHPVVGEALSLEQYTSVPHVILAYRTSTGSIVDRELKRHGLKRRIALQVPHFMAMPQIVRNSNFICTLPRRMAQIYADQLQLKILKTPIDIPPIPIYLMWGKSAGTDRGQDWLRQSFHGLCQRL